MVNPLPCSKKKAEPDETLLFYKLKRKLFFLSSKSRTSKTCEARAKQKHGSRLRNWGNINTSHRILMICAIVKGPSWCREKDCINNCTYG